MALSHWDTALQRSDALEAEFPASAKDESSLAYYRSRMMSQRADIQLRLGRIEEAQEALRIARELSAAANEHAATAAAALTEIYSRTAAEDFRGALALIERSADVAERVGSGLPASLACLRGWALVRLAEEQPSGVSEEGESLLELALAGSEVSARERMLAGRVLADAALNRNDVDRAMTTLAKVETVLGEFAVAPHEAASVSAVRARAARSSGASDRAPIADARTRLEADYAAMLDAWRSVERSAGELGLLQFVSRRAVISELIDITVATQPDGKGARAALQHLLDVHACGTLSLRLGATGTTVADVQARVVEGDDHVVVAFAPGADRLHVFAITGDSVELTSVDGYRSIRRSIRAFQSGLARLDAGHSPKRAARVSEQLLTASTALTRSLLPQAIARRIRSSKAVTFVGMDLLEGLPAEALTLDGKALLGETWATDTLPSLTAGVALDTRAKGVAHPKGLFLAGTGRAGVDVPDALEGSATLQAFEFDADTCQGVLSPYDEATRTFVGGGDLTLPALRGARLADYAVVHLFAHGAYDRRDVRGACLVVDRDADSTRAPNALLRCDDAERLGASGLVLLSACSAARGPRRLGDDALGHLGGAFLLGGAHAVMLSRAKTTLEWSLEGGELLHQRLHDGASPAAALRDVRRASRDWKPNDPGRRWRAAQTGVIGLGQRAVL